MSKKSLSVQISNTQFSNSQTLNKIYINFKNNLKILKKKDCLVAVSGGPDSLALTALAKLYSIENNSKFYYLHINHNIRAKSKKESKQLKIFLKKFKINLVILNNKKKITKNIQSEAREVRYNLLKKFCKRKQIKFILTAHHSDDQIETFLIRLSRGSGVQGLSSMSNVVKLDKDIRLIRPLLENKKNELISVSKLVFKKYFKDPSNIDKKFLRTQMRKVIEILEKRGIKRDQIIKSINNLAKSRETINSYLERVYENTVIKKRSYFLINYRDLKKESNEIKIRLLSMTLKGINKKYYPPREKKLTHVINNFDRFKNKQLTLAGCLIKKSGNLVEIKKEPKK